MLVHGWFAGFFLQKSRVICVVLAEDGRQGGTSAAPIFKEIADGIDRKQIVLQANFKI